MEYRMTIAVNAPIEKAFSLVNDAEELKLWMDGLMETTYTSPFDPANPVGTTFRQKIKEGGRVAEYEGAVTAYDKPTRLAVRIGNRHFDSHVDYRFTAEGRPRGSTTPARSLCTHGWERSWAAASPG